MSLISSQNTEKLTNTAIGIDNMIAKLASCCGPSEYRSPELTLSNGKVPSNFNGSLAELLSGADVWSLGITLFAMVTGRLPWSRACLSDPEYARYVHQYVHSDKDTVGSNSVTSEDFWPSELSLELRSLLSAVLHPDWRQRVDLETMKNHPWNRLSEHIRHSTSSQSRLKNLVDIPYADEYEPTPISYGFTTPPPLTTFDMGRPFDKVDLDHYKNSTKRRTSCTMTPPNEHCRKKMKIVL